MLRKVHDPGRLKGYGIEGVAPFDYGKANAAVSVRHVAEQTHAFAKELYEKLARKRAQQLPAKPTTLTLLEHTNTLLALILDKM